MSAIASYEVSSTASFADSRRPLSPARIDPFGNTSDTRQTARGFRVRVWSGLHWLLFECTMCRVGGQGARIAMGQETPKEVVARLSQETLAVMYDPEVVKVLTDQQVTPFALEPEPMEQLIRKDLDKWANVIKSAGIKPE